MQAVNGSSALPVLPGTLSSPRGDVVAQSDVDLRLSVRTSSCYGHYTCRIVSNDPRLWLLAQWPAILQTFHVLDCIEYSMAIAFVAAVFQPAETSHYTTLHYYQEIVSLSHPASWTEITSSNPKRSSLLEPEEPESRDPGGGTSVRFLPECMLMKLFIELLNIKGRHHWGLIQDDRAYRPIETSVADLDRSAQSQVLPRATPF